jgi:hypothetical protein
MWTLDEILEMVRKLSADDRQRVADEIEAITEVNCEPDVDGPYSALIALAGTIHSDDQDLSTNKYTRLGGAIAEHKKRDA